MWPILLDTTKEESMQSLRNLEFEAYSHLVSALRAQGPLSSDKRKLLQDTGIALSISQDRHKAEIRRAINDEKLNTIAYHVTGLVEFDDWALEGRRLIPLLPRMAPQTAYSAIADEAAENAYETNKLLTNQSNTEHKRQTNLVQTTQIPMVAETSKVIPFRIPENNSNKLENDSKKRKLPICTENSTLAQHLLGSAKMSRIQHVYKQRTKHLGKEQTFKIRKDELKLAQTATKTSCPLQPTTNGPKVNVLQNISLQSTSSTAGESVEQNEVIYNTKKIESTTNHLLQASCSANENQAPKLLATNLKQPTNLTFKQLTTSTGTSPTLTVGMEQKTIKVCPIRKPITKHIATNQKLIVVSNTQTIPTSSILHKTLSVPIVKNISMKNLEKFKIVTTTTTTTGTVPTVATTNLQITTNNNINSGKTKLLTVKTNPTKKVFHLSQLIGGKTGIKVLPIGGKIVGKTSTTTTTSPLIIMNPVNVQQSTLISKNTANLQIIPTTTTITNTVVSEETDSSNCGELSGNVGEKRENGKSSVLGDILRASGVTVDDTRLEETADEKQSEKTNDEVEQNEEQVEGVGRNENCNEEELDSVVSNDFKVDGGSVNVSDNIPMEIDEYSVKEISSNQQEETINEATKQEQILDNQTVNRNEKN